MLKEEMIKMLNESSIEDFPEIYVPSYHHPNFIFGGIIREFEDEAVKRCHIIVREEEKEQYLRENKDLIDRGCEFIFIPHGAVDGIGTTRNFEIEKMIEHGDKLACDFDDDIKVVNALYKGYTAKGDEKSTYFKKDDRAAIDHFYQKVLQCAGSSAKRVFKEHPNAIIGSMRRQGFSNNPRYHQCYAMINGGGGFPRAAKFFNVEGLEKSGLRVPEQFNRHGDDLGFSAKAVLDGYDTFILTSFIEDFVPMDKNSTLRYDDEEKNREIHKIDGDGLEEIGALPFFKVVKKYDDGTPMYYDINWKNALKLGYCDEPKNLYW